MKMLMLTMVIMINVSFASHGASGWTQPTLIKSVYIHSSGRINFYIDDTAIHGDCNANIALGHYQITKPNNMEKEMYSLLLAAHMANKKVEVFVGSVCGGYNAPQVHHIRTSIIN
jgi:hypothetical protein